MSWQVEITRGARKEMEKLPAHMQARIAQAILALENNPFPHDCKKLRNRDGWWSGALKVGRTATRKCARLFLGREYKCGIENV